MSEERVGGRAGTAASKGVVCELPNPPSSSLQMLTPAVWVGVTPASLQIPPIHEKIGT